MSEPQKITQLFGDDDVDTCDRAPPASPSFDDATPPHNQPLADSTSAHEQTPPPSNLVNVNDAKEEEETDEAVSDDDLEEMDERDQDEKEKRKRKCSLSSGSETGMRNKEQSPVPSKKDKPATAAPQSPTTPQPSGASSTVAEPFTIVHDLKLVDLLKKDCRGGLMRPITRELYEEISSLDTTELFSRALRFVAKDDGVRDFRKVDAVLVVFGSAHLVHFYTQQKEEGGWKVQPDQVPCVVEWINAKLFWDLHKASRRLNEDHSAILDKPIIRASAEGTSFLFRKLDGYKRLWNANKYDRECEPRLGQLRRKYGGDVKKFKKYSERCSEIGEAVEEYRLLLLSIYLPEHTSEAVVSVWRREMTIPSGGKLHQALISAAVADDAVVAQHIEHHLMAGDVWFREDWRKNIAAWKAKKKEGGGRC